MKKLSIFPILLIFVFSLCSCGGDNTRYDAIYDTETKQYISWGDTRETVIEAFGEGTRKQRPGERFETSEYEASASYYPVDNKELDAPLISFGFSCYTNGRYKILGISSEEEFLKKFPNAELEDITKEYMLHIAVDKNTGKYYLDENRDNFYKFIETHDTLIPAYIISVAFENDAMAYDYYNCMLDEEYEYYSNMKDHTIKDVQIIKE